MLQTETYTLEEEIDDLDSRIDDLEAELETLDPGTGDYEASQSRKSRLEYYRSGLVWQRDEEGWGPDAEVTLGAMDALEEAKMDRHIPSNAGMKERRLWFAAASTDSAPNIGEGDDLKSAFGKFNVHPGYAAWVESEANGLGVPDDVGN